MIRIVPVINLMGQLALRAVLRGARGGLVLAAGLLRGAGAFE
jgi:hypothetical protein